MQDTPNEAYAHAEWRVIPFQFADGATNMAVDEALAEAVGLGQQPPTLRFYGWKPACLSLGFSQAHTDVDLFRLKASGWEIVRRLTGGRAILHTDELTYSLAIPESDRRVAGGVVESYRRLSRGLLMGLEQLGAAVQSEKGDGDNRGFKGPVCFEVPSDYEITLNGKKLIGSAQTRRFNAILQHGTLPLYGDITRICDVLTFDNEAAREQARARVAERAATLGYTSAHPYEEVAQALIQGFTEALNLTFKYGSLSEAEQQRVAEIRETRYAAQAWTERH